MYFNQKALAPSTLAVWSRGGLDTLVKVAPIGVQREPTRSVGFCTTLRFLIGRTPAEMEKIIQLDPGTRLVNGADIFRINPLPSPSEFELKGYSPYHGEMPPIATGSPSHPTYPPGRGAPQWELAQVSQDRLVWMASVTRDTIFSFDPKRLPPAASHAPHEATDAREILGKPRKRPPRA